MPYRGSPIDGWQSLSMGPRFRSQRRFRIFPAKALIVSRAGATTSAERMAARKAAIMVPLPGQLEQRRNAEAMQSAGGARMILQDELSGARLAKEIVSLIDSPEKISEMEKASRKSARKD